MRKLAPIIALALGASLPLAAIAQQSPMTPAKSASAPAAKEIPVNRDQLSYAVGFEVGSNLANNKVDVDIKRVIQGLQDAYAKETPAVPVVDMREQLAGLQQRLRSNALETYKRLAASNLKSSEAFMAANKAKPGVITLADGIEYRVLEKGSGTVHPTATSTVTVHYRASLPDGQEFDSSYARGKPVTFQVDKMIRGWQDILPKMVAGDRWQVFVPPQLAFGVLGQPPRVGPNMALVFELKLLKVDNAGK